MILIGLSQPNNIHNNSSASIAWCLFITIITLSADIKEGNFSNPATSFEKTGMKMDYEI